MEFLRDLFDQIKIKLSSLFSGGRQADSSVRPGPRLARERRALIASRIRADQDIQPATHDQPAAGAHRMRPDESELTQPPATHDQPAAEAHRMLPDESEPPQPTEAGEAQPDQQSFQGYSVDSRARVRRPFYSPAAQPVQSGQTPAERQEADESQPERPASATSDGLRWQTAGSNLEAAGSYAPHDAQRTPDQTYGVDRLSRRKLATAAGAGAEAVADRAQAAARKVKGWFKPRVKPQNAALGVAFTALKLLVFAVLLLGVAGAGAVVGIAKAYVDTTPVLDVGKIQDQALTSFIYDGEGNLITTFAGLENRVWAPIDEIPKTLQDAIVAIEDARFYTHKGVDLKRIVGAFLSNVNSDTTAGGSTLTQQLIKNTLVTSERTYKRKIQEAWLAMQLEAQYKKPQILEAYLNTIPLGQSNYGVKAAAEDYFGKTLDRLTLRESAMLAGLAQSPYLYDPRRNTWTRNRMDITDKRTNTVLLCMVEQGYISKAEYEQALAETVTILKEGRRTQMYDMPYFVEYAIEDVIRHMLESRGLDDTAENRSRIDAELRTGGYKIYLSVDPQVQKTVEDTLYNYKKYPKMQISRDSAITVRDGASGFATIPQPQAAAVVLDYHTGQIKAIVGGRQQPKSKRTLNRAWQAHMPVGSCIKPLAVYAPAIDKGLSPASIVYNVPAPVAGWNTPQGFPSNYSGSSFTGPVSLRTGLIQSYNVVAARVLMDSVGVDDSAEYLKKLGVTAGVNRDGPGLALGTSGITLVEMAAAFGSFGNQGEYVEPLAFTKVVDAKGNTVLDADKVRMRNKAFEKSTAWLMVNMMTDAVNRGTGTRAKIPNMVVAGKTGTNSDYRGVSFNALTPYYSAAVWIGSDAYKPLYKGATGGTDAAPLWKAFMARIHADKGLKNRNIIDVKPESLGLVKATVCGVSGKLVTDACAADALYKPVTDWFLEGTVPTETCNLHYQMKRCKASGKIATPFCPPDQVEEGSVLLVPPDHIIRSMKPEAVLKHFPTALLDIPGAEDLSLFTPDNPDYADFFCPVHTQAWADVQPLYEDLAGKAGALVDSVKAKMDSYWLSNSVKDALNARIKTVNDILAKGFSDPLVPPATVYNNLVAAYNDLKGYADYALAEPTPTPTPEPTATAPPE